MPQAGEGARITHWPRSGAAGNCGGFPQCYGRCMPSLRLPTTIPLVLALTAGCDGGGSGGPVPIADLEARLLDASCGIQTRCAGFPDVATCKASLVSNTAHLVAGVNAGRIQYDGNAAAACIDIIGSLGCNLTDTPDNPPVACANTFKGSVLAGGTCYGNEECVSGECGNMSCPSSGTCCSGTCEDGSPASNPVPAGGDCSRAGVTCADGTRCMGSSDLGAVCTPGAALGEACATSGMGGIECLNHGVCLPSSSALGGTCAAPPAEGEACDTMTGQCNSSLDYCDPVAAKCVRKLGPGQPCPYGTGCVDYAVCASGTCVQEKKLGEICDDGQTSAICMGVLQCEGGVCVQPELTGVCP